MSYSIDKAAPSRAALKAAVTSALAEAMNQRLHDTDRATVINAVGGLIDAVGDPQPEQHVRATVHGHVNYEWAGNEPVRALEVQMTARVFIERAA